MKASKKELREEIRRLRKVAGPMSNMCYNLSQSQKIDSHTRDLMSALRIEYDAIARSET
jgi:hypothetical protein